jgi:hypothetical protein
MCMCMYIRPHLRGPQRCGPQRGRGGGAHARAARATPHSP